MGNSYSVRVPHCLPDIAGPNHEMAVGKLSHKAAAEASVAAKYRSFILFYDKQI